MHEFPFKKLSGLEWLGLNGMQRQMVKSITTAEIFEVIFSPIVTSIEKSIQKVFSYNFKKIRSLIVLKEVISEQRVIMPSLFEWTVMVLDKIGQQFNYKILTIKNDCLFLKLRPANVIEGAGRKILEKIKISDTIMAPKVIRRSTLNDEAPLSAIFFDAYPSIIVTIGSNICII